MRSRWTGLVTAVVVAATLVAARPASPARADRASAHSWGIIQALESRLVQAVEKGVSGTVTYAETNHGKTKGDTNLGVVGHGVFTTKVTPTASVAASLLGAVKGIPLTTLLAGGSYVARYDIDANGGNNGYFVATFTQGLGSICVKFDISRGKYVPGSAFIPASGSMSSAGGTGKLAALHGSATFKQTNVTGADVEKFFESAKLKSVGTGAKTPMSAACQAVAKLA